MMNGHKLTVCLPVALIFAFATPYAMQGQNMNNPYPNMAQVEQYMMDREAEIALARSAAPESISRDAKVLVFGRKGYETAVEGKNGFVCVVDRSWMLPVDKPDFWNPKVRLPLCMNPPAVRSHLPLTFKTTALALAGVSAKQMSDRLRAAFDNKELPPPEHGSMCYMMSKQQYFGDNIGNAGDSHLMFWFPQGEHMNWALMALILRWTCTNTRRSPSPSSRFHCPSGRMEHRYRSNKDAQCPPVQTLVRTPIDRNH